MKILIVDPDSTVQDLVINAISSEFRELTIEQVRRRVEFEATLGSWTYNLVLTELNLGWAEGIYVLKALRERMLQTPVILFSRAENEDRVIKQASYGFSDYVLKERIRRLPFAIKKALEHADLEKSLANTLEALANLSPSTSDRIWRERAEAALRQSEHRFASFFRANPIPSIIATFPDGVLQDINEAGQSVLGIDRASVLEGKLTDTNFWPTPEDRKLLVEELCKGNTPFHLETFLKCSDGRQLQVIVSAELVVEDDAKPYMLFMFQDVTERRRMEQSLNFRAQFETLVAEISTRFINVPTKAIDAEITKAIEEIGGFWGVDAAVLATFSEDLTKSYPRYYWSSEEHSRKVTIPTTIETADFPLLMSKLHDAMPINIPDLKSFAQAAPDEAVHLQKLGIKSAIIVPIVYSKMLLGVLCLASLQKERFWGEESTSLLKTAADIIANALTRKHTEERLAESRRNYKMAVEAGKVAVWEWMMKDGLIKVDPFLKKTLGYGEDELGESIESWLQLLSSSDVNLAKILIAEILQGSRNSIDIEVRLCDRAGQPRWFLVNGSVVSNDKMLGTLTEITDRKRAKLELDKFFNSAFDMLCVADTRGYFLRVNPAWERALGYSAEELTSCPYLEFVHPDDVEKTKYEAEKLANGQVSMFFENRYRTKDGRYKWLLWNATPAQDGLIYAVAHDITQRKKAEAALREREEQLRQMQKIDAIGQLAGGVAHDFNNIMTVIKGYCELASDSIQDGRSMSLLPSYIAEIDRATDRAASLTRQLLAFSRRQHSQPVVLSLNSVVEDMKKMLCRLLREDIELKIQLDPELGNVRIDKGHIEQVVLNLAINARDAMPYGGTLRICTSNIELDRSDFTRYVVLSVSDTGIGMDEETLKRIFEPFFTTKETGKGTGLGLATVHSIVTQSNGFIEVDSKPSQGSTFKIYLPRIDETQEVIQPDFYSSKLAVSNTAVLVVDDDLSVRTVIRICLEARGFKVWDAEDGECALRLCDGSDKLDLLITDLVMPKINGVELAERLKKLYPTLRLIYISGYSDEATKILPHPDMQVLEKPFSVDQLFEKITKVFS